MLLSNSLAHTTRYPACSNPRSRPPQPAKNDTTSILFVTGTKKPSLRFEKGAWKRSVRPRLSTAYIRQQSICPRPYERKHPNACPTDVFYQRANSGRSVKSRMSKTLYFLIRYSFRLLSLHKEQSANTLCERVSNNLAYYKIKSVGACICLFYSSWPTTAIVKRTSRVVTHVEVYKHP